MMGLGLIVLLVLGYVLLKNSGKTGGSGEGQESPLELLQKRYVNGEMSREEYQEKRDILKGNK